MAQGPIVSPLVPVNSWQLLQDWFCLELCSM